MTAENETTPRAGDDSAGAVPVPRAGDDSAGAVPVPRAGDDATGAVPGPIVPGDQQASDQTAAALMRLSEDDLPPGERRKALGQIAAALHQRGFSDFFKPKAAMNWIADTVVDIA